MLALMLSLQLIQHHKLLLLAYGIGWYFSDNVAAKLTAAQARREELAHLGLET
jgi:hypothetical protein